MGKSVGVLYLDRNGLWIFIASYPQVFRFVFIPTLVRDFEIVSKEDLQKQLTLFIDTNKLPPARMMMLISDAGIFEKDLPVMTETERVNHIQEYIDNVPFEDVGIKLIPFDKGVRVLATNRSLYETVKDIFEKRRIAVESVIPALIVAREVNLANGLDVRSGQYLAGKIDTLKQHSFPVNSQAVIKKVEQKPGEEPPKEKNKSLLYLIPVFLVLLAVMGYMLYQNFAPPAPVPVVPTQPTQNTQAVPTEIPVVPVVDTTQQATSSSSFDKNTIKVTILHSDAAANAEKLRQEIIKIGYKNVVVLPAGNSLTRAQVVIPSSMPAALKSELASQVAIVAPSPTIIENGTNEITITLGKP